jgi:hypothetical protein
MNESATSHSLATRQQGSLDEIQAICRLKSRYFRLLDTKQWDELRTIFVDDLVFEDEAKGRTFESADEFLAFLRERHAISLSAHQGFMPEIDIESDSRARGIWSMTDRVVLPQGSGRLVQLGAGHYHETYHKVGDQWRIARVRLSRLWLSIQTEQ